MDDEFKLNLKKLEPTSQYRLSVEYELENQKAIEALVDRVVPKDAPHKDEEGSYAVPP
jgi:flagellar basal body-associated protein FliL